MNFDKRAAAPRGTAATTREAAAKPPFATSMVAQAERNVTQVGGLRPGSPDLLAGLAYPRDTLLLRHGLSVIYVSQTELAKVYFRLPDSALLPGDSTAAAAGGGA